MYECYILNGEDSIEKAIGNIVNDLISAPRDDNGYSRLKAGTKGISANHELVGGCCLVRANNNNKNCINKSSETLVGAAHMVGKSFC